MNINIRTFSENVDLVNERREHVRKCATALFVKKPFHQASTNDILEACGMSKGGLYYYVGSKEDIISMILDHASKAYINVHQIIRERIRQLGASEALQEVIKILCRWMDENQDEVIVVIHEMGNLSREQREPQLDSERANIYLLENILKQGITSSEFRIDDTHIAAHTIFLGIRAWAERRWYLRKTYTLDKYIESLYRFTITSITTNNTSLLQSNAKYVT